MGKKLFLLMLMGTGMLLYTLPLTCPWTKPGQNLFFRGHHFFTEVNVTSLTDNKVPSKYTSQQTSLAEHVWSICQKLNPTSSAESNAELYKRIRVVDKYKVLACVIPKVACSNWFRVLLVLTGKFNARNILDIKSNDVHGRFRRTIPRLSDYNETEIKFRLDNYFKFMFVREPFQRVLSAWRNKFLSNLTTSKQFRKNLAPEIVRRFRSDSEGGRLATMKNADLKNVIVSLEEFLQYIIVKSERTKPRLNEHWERYQRLCHPCFMRYDFVGKYETIDQDADHVLKAVHADPLVTFPARYHFYKHNRTSVYLKEYYKNVAPALLRRIYDVYQTDFELFNYSVPDEIDFELFN